MNPAHLSARFLKWPWLSSVAALLVGFATVARAQPSADATGTLEGIVYNIATGMPLGRAKVVVRETGQEVLTDDDGRYSFRQAPARTLQVDVSYLGFEPQSRAVPVPANGVASQEFRLSREGAAKTGTDAETIVLEKFEVVAEQTMSAQALAMNEQRHAANIRNVVAFDELGDRGFENIGNYVRFLPGVAIIEDGENPGKISLGGFPAEMSSLQLDGADLAGTGIGAESSRTIALQEVPMMNIERVEVSKVPTPDMPAAGLGGSLNLVTKSLLGLKRPSFSYQAYMNFNNRGGLTFDGGPSQPTPALSPKHAEPSVNASLAMPVGKRLAFSLGASRSWKQRPADDTPSEVAFWNLRSTYLTGAPKDIAFAIGQWKQEADITRTDNFHANVDWKIAPHDTLTFGLQRRVADSTKSISYFTARVHINYDAIGDSTYSQSRGNTGRIEMGSNNPSNYESTTTNTQGSVQYRHRGSDWRIDGQASYARSVRERSSIGKGYFAGVMANIINLNMRAEGFNEGESIGPRTYTLKDASGRVIDPYDGDNYSLLNTTEEYAVYKNRPRVGASRCVARLRPAAFAEDRRRVQPDGKGRRAAEQGIHVHRSRPADIRGALRPDRRINRGEDERESRALDKPGEGAQALCRPPGLVHAQLNRGPEPGAELEADARGYLGRLPAFRSEALAESGQSGRRAALREDEPGRMEHAEGHLCHLPSRRPRAADQ